MFHFGWKKLSLGLPVLLSCYAVWEVREGELTLPQGLVVGLTDVVTHVTPKYFSTFQTKSVRNFHFEKNMQYRC